MSRLFPATLAALVMTFAVASLARADAEADIKAAAKSFGEALMAGDGPTARKYVVSNPESDSFVDAMTAVTKAKNHLNAEAVAKFGEDGKTVAGASSMGGRGPAAIDQNLEHAKVEVNGDTATVTGQSGHPVQFKKEGGQWKFEMTSLPNFSQSSRAIPMFNKVAAAMNETAEEVKAGKYATATEAQRALGQKIAASFRGGAGAPGGPGGRPGAPSNGEK